MDDALPHVTVIIAARPGQAEVEAVTAARALQYPPDKIEILVARGRQPAIQRNVAMQTARGDLLYFLDDDAKPAPENLRRAAGVFENAAVKMLGGPNLCPEQAPRLERVFAVVLGSLLAMGPSRARYEAVGRRRESSEKELILCNLMARRQAMLDLGGFDELLYPNEENALMDAIAKRGGKLIYDPAFIAHRRPRPTLKSFAKMLLTYGRGRAEQFRLHPTSGSVLNFAPPLFCLYLVVGPWFGWMGCAPLGLYALAVAGQTLVSGWRKGWGLSLLAAPLLVVTHVLYGLGFWRGLFTNTDKGAAAVRKEVLVERVASQA